MESGEVSEPVDERDLGSRAERRGGSNPPFPTQDVKTLRSHNCTHSGLRREHQSPGYQTISGGVMGSDSEIPRIALPQSTDWVARVRENAEYNMKRYESCSQSILAAFMGEFGVEDPLVMASAGGFHGGMMVSLTCGIYTSGLMVLGLLIGRTRIEQGLDGMYPIILPAQELLGRLKSKIGAYSCQELTGADFSDLNQAIAFMASEDYKKCRTRVADGAEEIGRFLLELNERGELFRPDLR